MNTIIAFVNHVIDVCVKCRHREECEWFQGAGRVILDDLTPEQYSRMTHEKIAARIHADVPAPPEICGQYTFDGMMEYLDEQLRNAQMPQNTEELLDLHYKISQLWRRLGRIPRDCRDPFDAPIHAIIDRVIAALDYHFLKLHLDIIDILLEAHHDYDRATHLRRDRVQGVVRVLLATAHKLTYEEIVAYKGDFKDYVVQNELPAIEVTKKDKPGTKFPSKLSSAIPYLDALQKHGFLDKRYHWIKDEKHTNYHASWASKIMVHNCPGASHALIGQLIGVPSLGSYVSLAKTKEPIKRLIEQLFIDEGLTVTLE
ncbi:MAG: hypothetical protein J5737_03180 [Bacteroidales bacterium]|nr:hypothetical protein [Bacteroidales bacterium]